MMLYSITLGRKWSITNPWFFGLAVTNFHIYDLVHAYILFLRRNGLHIIIHLLLPDRPRDLWHQVHGRPRDDERDRREVEEVDVAHRHLDPLWAGVFLPRPAGGLAETEFQDEADHTNEEAEQQAEEGALNGI